MTEDKNSPITTGGIALTGAVLSFCVITLLQKRGTISKAEMDDLFQGALEMLETIPTPDASSVSSARVLMDMIAQVAATGGTMKPKAVQ